MNSGRIFRRIIDHKLIEALRFFRLHQQIKSTACGATASGSPAGFTARHTAGHLAASVRGVRDRFDRRPHRRTAGSLALPPYAGGYTEALIATSTSACATFLRADMRRPQSRAWVLRAAKREPLQWTQPPETPVHAAQGRMLGRPSQTGQRISWCRILVYLGRMPESAWKRRTLRGNCKAFRWRQPRPEFGARIGRYRRPA